MTVGPCVVDTNVPIVANGQNSDICYKCRFRTIEFLEQLMNSGRLIVDAEGEVEKEYWANLRTGYPGVGNRFLQHFLNAHADRVERVPLGKSHAKGYDGVIFSGPLKNFDKSDRKFAALSVKTGHPIYVSVDSDWVIDKDNIQRIGAKIEFLCGEDQRCWYLSKP